MTTPDPAPSKAKAWAALLGGLLTVIIPMVVQVQDFLPQPWPALIGGVIALLTVFGVYHAPYVPPGAVIAPQPDKPSSGGYVNPWG